MAKIVTVYRSHGDGGERSVGPVIGYHSSNHLADIAATGKGWWGGNGGTSECKAIEVDGKFYALAQSTPIDLDGKQSIADAALRSKTLATLNDEQRRVLGLDGSK